MPLYVNYEPKTGSIVSFQEAPEGQNDEPAAGLEQIKVNKVDTDLSGAKVSGGQLVIG